VEKFIEEIYISPYAPDYLKGVVALMLDKFGYKGIKVIKSDLFEIK